MYATNITETNDYKNSLIILPENKQFSFDMGKSFVGWNLSYTIEKTTFDMNDNN